MEIHSYKWEEDGDRCQETEKMHLEEPKDINNMVKTLYLCLHSVSLPGGGLSICEDSAIISTQDICEEDRRGRKTTARHPRVTCSPPGSCLPFTICLAQVLYTCSWVVLVGNTRSKEKVFPCGEHRHYGSGCCSRLSISS